MTGRTGYGGVAVLLVFAAMLVLAIAAAWWMPGKDEAGSDGEGIDAVTASDKAMAVSAEIGSAPAAIERRRRVAAFNLRLIGAIERRVMQVDPEALRMAWPALAGAG